MKYKIAIDARNNKDTFDFITELFSKYGTIIDLYHQDFTKTENVPDEDDFKGFDIFEIKASKWRFKKLLKLMTKSGHSLKLIKGYYFL